MTLAVPELRFPEFKDEWKTSTFDSLLVRESRPVEVRLPEAYREIGVRSHGKGLFHKPPVLGSKLGSKRVFHVVPDALVLNIVFAWEQAVAITTKEDDGFIASHRFPMFLANGNQSYLPYILQFLLTPKGKRLLEIASPGGAGRNKTLGQDSFLKLKAAVPCHDEQKKIADFLNRVSAKVELLREKKTAFQAYKLGLMQQFFSGSKRFKQADGSAFPAWQQHQLGKFLLSLRERVPADTSLPVYSSSRNGLKKQEDYFADRQLANLGEYGVVPAGYITYRHMSDDLTFSFNYNDLGKSIAVSKEYPVFKTTGMDIIFLKNWLNHSIEFRRYAALQKKGGTRTRLYLKDLKSLSAKFPCLEEQRKIASVLSALDIKIAALAQKIDHTEAFKTGLLQKLFV